MMKPVTIAFACLLISAAQAHARPVVVAAYAPDRHGAVVYHPYPPMFMGGHAMAVRLPRAKAVHAPVRTASAQVAAEPVSPMGGHWIIAKARMYVGTNPTGWHNRWCGKFMSLVVGGQYASAAYLRAAYWLKAGHAGPPGPGAIAVWNSHVGVVVRLTRPGFAVVLSGNTGPAGNRRVMEEERSIAGAKFRYI